MNKNRGKLMVDELNDIEKLALTILLEVLIVKFPS